MNTVAVGCGSALQKDAALCVHSLAGVVQQVQAHGLHQIRLQLRCAGSSPDLQADARLFQRRPQDCAHPLQKGRQLSGAGREAALFQNEQVQQPAGQALQPTPLPEDMTGALPYQLRLGGTGEQELCIADDGRQGRLGLVGEGVEEVLLPAGSVCQLAHVPLQLLRHKVEIPGELAQLVVTADSYPPGQLPGGHLPRCLGQPPQGAGEGSSGLRPDGLFLPIFQNLLTVNPLYPL